MRKFGPLTVYLTGSDEKDMWMPLVVHKGQMRLGQALHDIEAMKGYARVSVSLWDSHHAKWAKRRAILAKQVLGFVRADDLGLVEFGIPVRRIQEVTPKLIAIGV